MRQRSVRTGRFPARIRKPTYLPITPGARTKTWMRAPAARTRLKSDSRTRPVSTTRLRKRHGQPPPVQRTVTRAPRGAPRTSTSVMRAPRGTTTPTSRTVGKGLISLGAAHGATGQPTTVMVRVMTRDTPSPSVTRSDTSWSPAPKLAVAEGPEASSKSPSPSRSQASVDRPLRVHGGGEQLHHTAGHGTARAPDEAGHRRRVHAEDRDRVVALAVGLYNHQAHDMVSARREGVRDGRGRSPTATPSISQLSVLPAAATESEVNVAC